jgi:hypothetical protein
MQCAKSKARAAINVAHIVCCDEMSLISNKFYLITIANNDLKLLTISNNDLELVTIANNDLDLITICFC